MEKFLPFQEDFQYKMSLNGLVAMFRTGYFQTTNFKTKF